MLSDEMKAGIGQPAQLSQVTVAGEPFYKISNAGSMRPFFMTVVSHDNHWMFVASNGGISAGRKNANYALFPYYTDDKIIDTAEITGSKTIVKIKRGEQWIVWEPFSMRSEAQFACQRNVYKSRYGNKIIFEEVNEQLGLAFSYQWSSSSVYGFVRHSYLRNIGAQPMDVEVLDGLQNILPYGVPPDLQTKTSNLADAYKRTELDAATGVGIFALSAIIVDKAEPSEALKTNVVWALGAEQPLHLLSTQQLDAFRKGYPVSQELDIKGQKGCYFMAQHLHLEAGEQKTWMLVANVNQNHAGLVWLMEEIRTNPRLMSLVEQDIAAGQEQLIKMVAAADGLQATSDALKDTRHFSNVLFNIMRGGLFDDHYQIEKWDFERYLYKANKLLYAQVHSLLDTLPASFTVMQLKQMAGASANLHILRLATEYLPLKFSRRHGDPSRPWNQFSINVRSEQDGSKILDYEGNWRDIFQNWEALAIAYPGFLEGIIFKFLNASTFDGYNPYRITKDGFDWETIEPDNPWSYIGYWGDHQIIYLLKFFEQLQGLQPTALQSWLQREGFVYAHVPYTIKPYQNLVHNAKDTIDFDHQADHAIRNRITQMGSDGALLPNAAGQIHTVSFAEKLLATVLAKLTNLVPDGGIWMNTQRPEWNDANNALVGNGLSMVTLCYLRRFLHFFEPLLGTGQQVKLSTELASYFEEVATAFKEHQGAIQAGFTSASRRSLLDALGNAASRYRWHIYEHGFSGSYTTVEAEAIVQCFSTAKACLEAAIQNNQRPDGLFHTYNLLTLTTGQADISHLSEMLEGQVAVLSAGYLSPAQSLQVLDALRHSALYRPDQYSYILYPNKNLPGFLAKNNIAAALATHNELVSQLLADGNTQIIERDVKGQLHFNGNFRNAADLATALQNLPSQYEYLVDTYGAGILDAFEEAFKHKEFTGRSGTFYGYEGLGSIYWHMVSKLLLAVQENCLSAIETQADAAIVAQLVAHYYQIQEGIGVHKPVSLYGAFTTDAYSHTPMGRGAQQPGMTGQVKEDIICRFGELGVVVKQGQLCFKPAMLKRQEFTATPTQVVYIDLNGQPVSLLLPAQSLLFTYCQVPVIYTLASEAQLVVAMADGTRYSQQQSMLPASISQSIWNRTGQVTSITVNIPESAIHF